MSGSEGITGITGVLTDGTGVSPMLSGSGLGGLLGSKVVKDIVLDFVLSAPIALAGVSIAGLDQALAAPLAAGLALGDSLIRTLARAVIRWAQS